MTTIYSLIDSSFNSLGLIRPQNIIESFSCSLGCHLINLANLRACGGKGMFFHAGKRMNFRKHINLQAPSGFFKTTALDYFLDAESGLLAECSFPTNVEATFTPESWAGTLSKGEDGEYYLTNGVYDRYGDGIIGADEFTTLKEMMDDKGARNDVVYLLKGLEGSHVSKNMAGGVVSHKQVGTTLWCCMRPTRLNFTSGLGRRFNFITYYPTIKEAYEFKKANTGTKLNTSIDNKIRLELKELSAKFIEEAIETKEIDLSAIDAWLMERQNLPHFEHAIYKRIALGWSIINGKYPIVSVDDKLLELFESEFRARLSIKHNPICDAMAAVIKDYGEIEKKEFTMFMIQYYQLTGGEVESNLKRLIRGEKRVRERNMNGKSMLSITNNELKVEIEREELIEDIIIL
jgi:hypothetical protein